MSIRLTFFTSMTFAFFPTDPKKASDERIIEFFDAGGYDAMVKLRDEGVVSAIGGGINEWEVCETLARRGDFDVFLLAGRYTLLEQNALDSFYRSVKRAELKL